MMSLVVAPEGTAGWKGAAAVDLRDLHREHRLPLVRLAALLVGDEAEEVVHVVIAALRSLPGRQKECLALRYYLDLSEAEIAAALGISPGSVKTHVHRGLAALAERLKEPNR